MKRVLVISAHYPPIGGSQSVRAAKLLKYLPTNGWMPDVVCSSQDTAFPKDLTLLAELDKSSTIYRVAPCEWAGKVVPRSLRVPDHLTPWIPPAFMTALKLAHGGAYSAMISLSFPPSSHVVALMVQALTGLPWLADFSDPWTSNPYQTHLPTTVSKVNKWLEGRVLTRAFTVGAPTGEMWESFSRLAAGARAKPMITPNTAEAADFPEAPARPVYSTQIVFVHIGSLYGIRRADGLLEGLARFIRGAPGSGVKVRFVGMYNSSGLLDSVRRLGLENSIEFVGFKSRREAMGELMSADAAILIDPSPTEPGVFLPQKLPEYLVSGKPILALTGEGPSKRLVERYNAGVCARWDDFDAIARAFETLTASVRNRPAARPRTVVEVDTAEVGRRIASALDGFV